METSSTGDDATLRAAIDRIIPPDQDPGATDLGVDRFIARLLESDAREAADAIRSGLRDLDSGALLRFGSPFAELDAARQDAILAFLSDEPWFTRLAELAAEGFYADPGNGGNTEARAWAMIGYEHRLPEGPSGPSGRQP